MRRRPVNGREPDVLPARMPRPYSPEPSIDAYERQAATRREREAAKVGHAVQEAVARALDAIDENRVVVINLTVQYASGGGATNVIGEDARSNGRQS
jgi:hypothetical protein